MEEEKARYYVPGESWLYLQSVKYGKTLLRFEKPL